MPNPKLTDLADPFPFAYKNVYDPATGEHSWVRLVSPQIPDVILSTGKAAVLQKFYETHKDTLADLARNGHGGEMTQKYNWENTCSKQLAYAKQNAGKENAPQLSPGKLMTLTVMTRQLPYEPINEQTVRANVRQLESQPGYQALIETDEARRLLRAGDYETLTANTANALQNAQPNARPNARPNAQPNVQQNAQPNVQQNAQPNAQQNAGAERQEPAAGPV